MATRPLRTQLMRWCSYVLINSPHMKRGHAGGRDKRQENEEGRRDKYRCSRSLSPSLQGRGGGEKDIFDFRDSKGGSKGGSSASDDTVEEQWLGRLDACKSRCKNAGLRCKYECCCIALPDSQGTCRRKCWKQVKNCIDRKRLKFEPPGLPQKTLECHKKERLKTDACHRDCCRPSPTPTPPTPTTPSRVPPPPPKLQTEAPTAGSSSR